MEDNEATFAELRARIDKTLAYVKGASEAEFEGAEERKIILPFREGKYMTGMEYVLGVRDAELFLSCRDSLRHRPQERRPDRQG